VNGLVYRDNIAVTWRYVDHALDAEHLARVNASNESFLRGVTALGEVPAAGVEADDGASGIGHELQRLDSKLNLLLELVSSLIYREADIAAPRMAEVAADAVTWVAGDERLPEPGRTVFLELYIQRGLPKPLCCYGEVLPATDLKGQVAIAVRYLNLGGSAKAWLEKWIFRQHRREVAAQRG